MGISRILTFGAVAGLTYILLPPIGEVIPSEQCGKVSGGACTATQVDCQEQSDDASESCAQCLLERYKGSVSHKDETCRAYTGEDSKTCGTCDEDCSGVIMKYPANSGCDGDWSSDGDNHGKWKKVETGSNGVDCE